jgi:hypothetical protein
VAANDQISCSVLSVPEYSRFPLRMQKGVTGLVILFRVSFWEELRYSGKVIAEDRLDAIRESPNLNRIRFFVSL